MPNPVPLPASVQTALKLRRLDVGELLGAARVSSFFWIQSTVRHDPDRALLFDLDLAIRGLRQSAGDNPNIVRATGVYHNLLRRWAEM